MRSRPDSYEPWWAPGTGAGFRQRCASALTHPATVVALATLLLNDLLFKAMWPDAWVTGKLSDLAWVALALPLLAFLLSLFTRGNVIAARTAFLTAYAGLPLLYAAFNTFEPVHYWILRGISIASGGMGQTPLDATDSIVIPLGCAVAMWVWRRPILSAEALRLRWGLLVASVAVLASIATSPNEPDLGIIRVGVITTEERSVVVARNTFGWLYWSDNGGVTWTRAEELTERSVVWGGDSVQTPRGRYTVEGADIVLLARDLQAEIVYSTAYLSKSGNVWVQGQSTGRLDIRRLATQPGQLVYDERSGHLVVALGIQGVLVGTPEGQWVPIAVGRYTPTDFTFLGKTHHLLTNYFFWAVAAALSLSMTGAGLIFSKLRDEDPLFFCAAPFVGIGILMAFGGLAFVLGASFLAIYGSGIGALLPQSPILIVSILSVIIVATPIAGGVALGFHPRPSGFLTKLKLGTGSLSLLLSGGALVVFGGPDPAGIGFEGIWALALSALSVEIGLTCLAVSWRLIGYWLVALASLLGMILSVVLCFMLWLHVGIPLALVKTFALALTGVEAYLLVGYMRKKTH